jgi:hypothetical protein
LAPVVQVSELFEPPFLQPVDLIHNHQFGPIREPRDPQKMLFAPADLFSRLNDIGEGSTQGDDFSSDAPGRSGNWWRVESRATRENLGESM